MIPRLKTVYNYKFERVLYYINSVCRHNNKSYEKTSDCYIDLPLILKNF